MSLSILRRPELERRIGMPRSSLYAAIAAGLLPRPVRLSAQAVGWPSGEVDQIIAARIAGKSDEEIKKLVAKLTASRTSKMEAA